jgi:hypothetical protein
MSKKSKSTYSLGSIMSNDMKVTLAISIRHSIEELGLNLSLMMTDSDFRKQFRKQLRFQLTTLISKQDPGPNNNYLEYLPKEIRSESFEKIVSYICKLIEKILNECDSLEGIKIKL